MKIIVDPIYGFRFMVIHGGNLQSAIDRFCKHFKLEAWKHNDRTAVGHFATRTPHRRGLIWFNSKNPNASLIAHECFHAVMYVFEFLGMDGPVEKTEEVFAYYLSWLIQEVT